MKIFTDLNDDMAHARHVSFIHGHTAKIRAILDEIDANPELKAGILNAGAA
jgi:hypothetical protein